MKFQKFFEEQLSVSKSAKKTGEKQEKVSDSNKTHAVVLTKKASKE